MNGDILTTLAYRSLMDFHLERDAALTIAMRHTQVDIDLGVIETRGSLVSGYREKPSLHYDVSMGIYVYDERALEHLPQGPASSRTWSCGSSRRGSGWLHTARTTPTGSTSALLKSTSVRRGSSSELP